MTPPDWTTAVLALLALVISAWATATARASARDTRRQAVAAEEQVALMRADRDETLKSRAAASRWRVDHRSGALYTLTNIADEVASSVEVTPPPYSQVRGEHAWEAVAPHASVGFFVAPSMATPSPYQVVVSWSSASAEGSISTDLLLPDRSRS